MIGAIFSGIVDLLAPPGCAACAAPLAVRESPFCTACEPLVEPLDLAHEGFHALFRYGGPVAAAIRRLKYEGFSEVAQAFSADLRAAAAGLPDGLDAVTAIPLTRKRLRERGYNQSGLIARQVARARSLPYRPYWLERVREAHPQAGQSRAQRLAQVHGAFVASPKVAGKTLVVVDDVRTTGATLADATRALHEAGARAVVQLTLAFADAP